MPTNMLCKVCKTRNEAPMYQCDHTAEFDTPHPWHFRLLGCSQEKNIKIRFSSLRATRGTMVHLLVSAVALLLRICLVIISN